MLLEFARDERFRQSGGLHADLSSCLFGDDKDSQIELDVENQYIMSPKDLKTIHFMNKMMDAGVRVFKIEGRARGPEYVRLVTECYKEAVRPIAKVRSMKRRLRLGTNVCAGCLIVVSGMAIIWDNDWVSGAVNMAPVRPSKKVYVAEGIKYFDGDRCGGV